MWPREIAKMVLGVLPLILILFTLIQTTSGFSLTSFLSAIGSNLDKVNAEPKEKRHSTENTQNIRVFEADSPLLTASPESIASVKQINDEDNIILSPDEDNFFVGESAIKVDPDHHSNNAIYTILPGDSLNSVANYFSISPNTILSFNNISLKDFKPGKVIEVPPIDGVYYKIKKGDTLNNLANKFKVDIDDITLFNGLVGNEVLIAGEQIFLPGAVAQTKSSESGKTNVKQNNLAKGPNTKTQIIDPVLGNLTKYIKNFGYGSTAQKSKLSDVKKYASLPKHPGYYIMPAPGTKRTQTMHGNNGSDFAGPMGTPVLASAGGTVRVAKSSGYNFGYGNYIIITHANGSETVYAHLSRVFVSPGQTVGQGAQIGAIGSSGNSTGPHLHFEIRGAYNPWAW